MGKFALHFNIVAGVADALVVESQTQPYLQCQLRSPACEVRVNPGQARPVIDPKAIVVQSFLPAAGFGQRLGVRQRISFAVLQCNL